MDIVVMVSLALLGAGIIMSPGNNIPVTSLRTWLDECGFTGVPIGVLGVVLCVLAVVTAGLVATAVPIPSLSPIAGIAALAVPIAALDAARTRRRTQAEASWPDVIDTVRMALRAGSALHESFVAAQPQIPREWAGAWSRVISDLARGASIESALGGFRADRAEPVADRFCEALVLAHEMGGTELLRLLEELGRTIREEVRMRREATSRQSWVRHAARLGSAAPWVVVVMLGSRPENREVFASPAGTALLVGCAGATLVAYIVMSAMGRLPEQPRWVTDA